jgi:hypothetical protein
MAGIARKIEVSTEDRETLLKWKRSPTTPQRLVRRAEIILAAAEGPNNKVYTLRGISDMGHFLNRTLWSRQRGEVAP